MSPHVLWPKSKKHKIETITNSIKTLKMVHIKKKKSLKTKVVRWSIMSLLVFCIGGCGLWKLVQAKIWTRKRWHSMWASAWWPQQKIVNFENYFKLYWVAPVAQTVKNTPAWWETWVQSLGWEYPIEEGMATHSSILTWRIPWTEEPGEIQSMGLQRVGHDWATNTWIEWHFHNFFPDFINNI